MARSWYYNSMHSGDASVLQKYFLLHKIESIKRTLFCLTYCQVELVSRATPVIEAVKPYLSTAKKHNHFVSDKLHLSLFFQDIHFSKRIEWVSSNHDRPNHQETLLWSLQMLVWYLQIFKTFI